MSVFWQYLVISIIIILAGLYLGWYTYKKRKQRYQCSGCPLIKKTDKNL